MGRIEKIRSKNWHLRLHNHLEKINCDHFLNGNEYSLRQVISTCEQGFLMIYMDNWRNELNREHARRGNGRNKLRTYRKFKCNFKTEPYVKVLMPYSRRSSLAKFRTGVPPLRLETGRYENLAVDQRTCFTCHNLVESEQHVLLNCPLYEDLHHELFNRAFELNSEFYSLNDNEKLIFLFTTSNMIKTVAKTCKDILDRRGRFLYK